MTRHSDMVIQFTIPGDKFRPSELKVLLQRIEGIGDVILTPGDTHIAVCAYRDHLGKHLEEGSLRYNIWDSKLRHVLNRRFGRVSDAHIKRFYRIANELKALMADIQAVNPKACLYVDDDNLNLCRCEDHANDTTCTALYQIAPVAVVRINQLGGGGW